MDKQIVIHFGCLADSTEDQLKQQKLKYNKTDAEQFQFDMESMDRLRVRGLLTDSQTEKVRQKLYKRIVAHVAKCEGMKVKK